MNTQTASKPATEPVTVCKDGRWLTGCKKADVKTYKIPPMPENLGQ